MEPNIFLLIFPHSAIDSSPTLTTPATFQKMKRKPARPIHNKVDFLMKNRRPPAILKIDFLSPADVVARGAPRSSHMSRSRLMFTITKNV